MIFHFLGLVIFSFAPLLGSALQVRPSALDNLLKDVASFKAIQRHNATHNADTEIGLPVRECVTPVCDRSDDCKGPNCCHEVMLRALIQITNWFDEQDIEYVLLFGTLLGAHRDKSIIPWTADLDLGIYSRDSSKLYGQRDIPFSFGFADGYYFMRGCENRNLRIGHDFMTAKKGNCSNCVVVKQDELGEPGGWHLEKHGSYYIDIYQLDGLGSNDAQGCINANGGLPLSVSKVQIGGHQFTAPKNIEGCLEYDYGRRWQVPDIKHAAHGKARPGKRYR